MRYILFNLFFYTFTVLMAVISVPVSVVAGDRTVRWLFSIWARGTVWLVRYVLGARVEIRGREHIAQRPALLVSKHQSELDVALTGTIFPDYGAIAMRELDNYPLVGGIVRKLGHIKVTVEGERRNQLPEVLDGARRVHAEGRPILIYPEGTLMHPGRKARYRGGVWHIYNELGVAATPGPCWRTASKPPPTPSCASRPRPSACRKRCSITSSRAAGGKPDPPPRCALGHREFLIHIPVGMGFRVEAGQHRGRAPLAEQPHAPTQQDRRTL